MTNKVLRGIVHGQTIELQGDSGIADGEEVEVVVRRVVAKSTREPGEGLLRTEGALVDDPHWDTIADELQEARKHERRPQWEDV
jgi:hypothetical protein